MSIDNLFFELLQVAIGNRDTLSVVPTKEQWTELFVLSKKQALVAVAFRGISKQKDCVQDGMSPICKNLPEILYLKWLGMTAKIAQRNKESKDLCRNLSEMYRMDGFDCCVMKGQSNRLYYPDELAVCRSSGDIDMWMRPMNKVKHPVAETMHYFQKKDDIVSLCYLHIENKHVDSVPLEVHFRPSFFNEPIINRRFLRWMKWNDCVEWSDILGFNVLKTDYNLVFQMNHLYRHLLDEGIGLRQVLDYYFLLKKFTQGDKTRMHKKDLMTVVKRLGMERFAGALMWVLMVVLAMPKEELLCETNEKDGRFLLDEIMRSGNFGHYDPRMQKLQGDSHSLHIQLHRVWLRMRRNIRFVISYPSEVVFEPIARAEHFLWRKLKLWRF